MKSRGTLNEILKAEIAAEVEKQAKFNPFDYAFCAGVREIYEQLFGLPPFVRPPSREQERQDY